MGLLGKIKKHAKRIDRSLNKARSGHCCNVCEQTFHHFYPFEGGSKAQPAILFELDIVGSDVDHFSCPHCGAHDRERHLLMYLDAIDLWPTASGRVLHFAPEKHIRKAILSREPQEYVCGDLFPTGDDMVRIDVTAIQFQQDHFDLVICNHVLEHVPDLEKGLAELYRVMKPGGRGIFQTPYSARLEKTFEDPGIDTDELRTRLYGQKDHVRVFGRDFFEILKQAGFETAIGSHQELLPGVDHNLYGVNPKEDLALVQKPA